MLITEAQFDNNLDLPVALPSTEVKQGDWLTIATVLLEAPAVLTYQFATLQMLGTSIPSVLSIDASNKINPSLDLAFLGLYLNFDDTTHPANQSALDTLVVRDAGTQSQVCLSTLASQGQFVVNRTAAAIVVSAPGVYSWVIGNNMQASTEASPGVPPSTSIDFNLAATGSFRLTLVP